MTRFARDRPPAGRQLKPRPSCPPRRPGERRHHALPKPRAVEPARPVITTCRLLGLNLDGIFGVACVLRSGEAAPTASLSKCRHRFLPSMDCGVSRRRKVLTAL